MASTKPALRSETRADGIRIRLLGNLQVLRGGREELLPASKRTRALLGYLAALGEPRTRQHLCDLLWDGPDDPRAALRWSLTKLRPIVNVGAVERLEADREHVGFVARDAFIDVARIAELLGPGTSQASIGRLEEAASLLQGEFLDGLDLPHCYRFHHWCMAERQRLGQLRRRVLDALIQRADDPERSLAHAHALVSADPLSEAAHATLVRLLVEVGRMRDADAHFEHARDLLRRELAAPLSGELRRPTMVARSTRIDTAGRSAAVSPAADDTPSAAPAQPPAPFVGRRAERRTIEAAVTSLAAGRASSMLLFMGEPGIGKTRLLQILADTATQAGVRVISARCFEGEMIRPYGLWIDALEGFPNDDVEDRAGRHLGSTPPAPATGAANESSREKLFEHVAGQLGNMAKQQPLAIALDDLQWIDEGSASLLHFLIRTGQRVPRILFVGAARDGEVDDNPWAQRLLSSLERDRRVDKHTLGPLDVAETASLFEDGLSQNEAAEAHRATGGNPLFALEVARGRRNGQRIAAGEFNGLIADRITRLDEARRELIQSASAIGRAFSAELVGAALERSEIALHADLEQLERRGLLHCLPDGQYDFIHDLVRQATYQALPQARRRMIHRRLAHALAAAAQNDDSLFGDLAHHAGIAEDHVLAAEAYVAAGERCLRVLANSEAENAADRGLAHLLQVGAISERMRLQMSLFRVKIFAAASPGALRAPELMDELKRSIEQAEGLGLHATATLGSHLLSWMTQRTNDPGGVRAATLHAEAMSRTTDDATRCQQLANTGRCLLDVEANIDEARAFLREADMLAARLNLRVIELDWGKGLLARWDGDLDSSHAATRRALALARIREDRWREIECLVWLGKIDLERGRSDDVVACCRDMTQVAERIGDMQAPMAGALRALACYRQANGSAMRELDDALVRLRAFDDKANLAYVLNQYAAAELGRHDRNRAEALADEALAAAEVVQRITEVAVARAILLQAAAANGNDEAAAVQLARLASLGAGQNLSARAQSFLELAYGCMPQSLKRRFQR